MEGYKELPHSKVSSYCLWFCAVMFTLGVFISIHNASKLKKIERIVNQDSILLKRIAMFANWTDKRDSKIFQIVTNNNKEIETIYSMFSVLNERKKEKLKLLSKEKQN